MDALQEALVNLLVVPKSEKDNARLNTVCVELQRVFSDAIDLANTSSAGQDSQQGAGQKGSETTK